MHFLTASIILGYGDIAPLNVHERIVSTVVMVVGCVFFAWATGRITQLLTHEAKGAEKFKTKISELNEFLDSRSLSYELTENIKSYYMMKYPTAKIYDERQIMDELPHGLKRQFQLELFQDLVKKVPLFAKCDDGVQIDVCQRLTLSYPSAGIEICAPGELAETFHMVRYGVVDVFHEDNLVLSARPGDLFGESAIFGLVPDGRRKRLAISRTVCEIGSLRKQDLLELLQEHRSFRKTFDRMMQLHISSIQHAIEGENAVAGDELLYTIRWKEILRHIEMSGISISPIIRTVSRSDSSHHASSSPHLITRISIHFGTLGPLPVEDCTVKDSTKPLFSFLALSWKENDDAEPRRTFTPIFRLDRQTCLSPVVHSLQLFDFS